nr:hypothetical protein CFP56_67394 [Quercus suber]
MLCQEVRIFIINAGDSRTIIEARTIRSHSTRRMSTFKCNPEALSRKGLSRAVKAMLRAERLANRPRCVEDDGKKGEGEGEEA